MFDATVVYTINTNGVQNTTSPGQVAFRLRGRDVRTYFKTGYAYVQMDPYNTTGKIFLYLFI